MVELLVALLLERMDVAALRIEARRHVLDDAILAGGIHRLKNNQHGPLVLGIEPFLQAGEPRAPSASIALASSLSTVKPAALGGIAVRQAEFVWLVDAEAFGDGVELHASHATLAAHVIAGEALRQERRHESGIAGSKSAGPRTMRISASSGCART